MKLIKSLRFGSMAGGLALACALLSTATTSRANIYATDIKVLGVLTNGPVPVPLGGSTAITYILNETASNGVSINIQSSSLTNTRTISITMAAGAGGKGTTRGTNLVVWDGNDFNGNVAPVGTYSFSITAATRGYTVWTQTSVDTSAGMPAHYPLGIDVDKNTNSPYYGRVVMGCALHTGTPNVPAAAMKTGLFKMNADGSQADEGWYGNANYLEDDGDDAPVAGQMPDSGGFDPMKIRVSDDDRIYWVDNSHLGAVIACDMQATTNQIVINESGYSQNPDYSDLGTIGFQVFDVAFTSTTNASVWLGDNNYPSWGYWMFHMTNGAVDPNDYYGTQVVEPGGDLAIVSLAGCTVDTNLDFFCGQARNNENAFYDAMLFSNWNGGILPPENSLNNNVMGANPGEVAWGYGCGIDVVCATDPSFESSEDTVINSRTSPTIVACPMGEGSQFVLGKTGGGIRLLNAQTGAIITAGTNVYTNLDNGEAYPCAAWDNVGNLYGASTTRNLWRVYSPPGGSTNTTLAVETMAVQALPATASLAVSAFSGNAAGNATQITANFDGTPPITLQWYSIDLSGDTNAVSGQVINTATTSTLALSNLTDAQNGYQYFLSASNSIGGTNTTTATLTVINPTVTLAATTFGGDANGAATNITATTNGTFSPTLQWYSIDLSNNTNAVPGQTNATLALTGLSASQNGYKYFVVASWTYAPSVASSSATLTVWNTPVVTTQPTPLTEYVPIGYADSFAVTANGALPLSYQWYNDGNPISGATATKYSFAATNGTHTYYVNVYNSVDPAGVNSATATVTAPPTALSFASTLGSNTTSSTGWDLNGTSPAPTFVSPGVLQMTTATGSLAHSAFYALGQLPVSGFVATFTYVDANKGAADGTTFCLQDQGPTAVGGTGGSLGVSGLHPSVELEMNLYTGASGGTGMAFATNGGISKNIPTTPVLFTSGDPINVTIVYTPGSMWVHLLDTTSNLSYTTTYSGSSSNNITNVLGTNIAWVGFTGATGGSTSVQQISNFLFQSTSNAVLSPGTLTTGSLPFTWNVAGMSLQESPTVQGPWSNVSGTVTTNFVTGQASMTVTPAAPDEFFRLVTP